MTSTTIPVTFSKRTHLALLVSDGLREAWVPLSEIERIEHEQRGMGLEIAAITIPQWLAEEKGLQARQGDADDCTADLFGGEA